MSPRSIAPRGTRRLSFAVLRLTLALGSVSCADRGCTSAAPKTAPTEQTKLTSDEGVAERLHAALLARGPGYVPRTRHLKPDGSPKYTNRLILESSPYLLQHAHNPVNWFAWGDEAFARARVLDRPIFLSIGYATCHWCHVMEEESFEDEQIAAYLNAHYVCIKVDREVRPDVDAVYMAFVQGLTGRGGWPMNVWLTPTREPFFGGTYFPPRAGVRGANAGFLELLTSLSERFAADPKAVAAQARGYAQRLRAAETSDAPGNFPSASVLSAASNEAARRFDPVNGGQRGAPKFPSSFPIRPLLRSAQRQSDLEARKMALTTLDHMRHGGIYDQLGGGFHRYATDASWLVPHFEKMLYDNALLAVAYLEAEQLSGDRRYGDTVREILDYLLREMQAGDGSFYSATDADSPNAQGRREEGLFFTWTKPELANLLGEADARLAAAWFGVSEGGEVDGRSVLRAERSPAEVARDLDLTIEQLDARLAQIRLRMFAQRATRPGPLRDEKAIVSANGLTISALARAAIVLGEPRYAQAARRAAHLFSDRLVDGGELPHVLIDGQAQGRGFSDDYAALAAALLDVFELTADPTWLAKAELLMEYLERAFADRAQGGYYLTDDHHEQLLIRSKPDHDGPTPSVSSMAAMTWLRLFAFTDDARFKQRAETTLRAFTSTLTRAPLALDQMLLAIDWVSGSVKEVVIVVPPGHGALSPSARPLLDVLASHFAPNCVLLVASEEEISGELGKRVPWVREKTSIAGQVTAYVCERSTCKLPTNDPQVFAKQLTEVGAAR